MLYKSAFRTLNWICLERFSSLALLFAIASYTLKMYHLTHAQSHTDTSNNHKRNHIIFQLRAKSFYYIHFDSIIQCYSPYQPTPLLGKLEKATASFCRFAATFFLRSRIAWIQYNIANRLFLLLAFVPQHGLASYRNLWIEKRFFPLRIERLGYIYFAWKPIETCFDRLVEMVLPNLRSFINRKKSHKIGSLPGSFRAAYGANGVQKKEAHFFMGLHDCNQAKQTEQMSAKREKREKTMI